MVDRTVFRNGIQVGNLIYPTSDGSAGQVLTTDGNGNLSLQDPSGGTSSGGGGVVERVRVNYNSNFTVTGTVDETSNVTSTVENDQDAILSFDFSNFSFPPASIFVYAFDVANNQYTIGSVTDAEYNTNFLVGGDTQFGSFTGPLRFQLDETTINLNNDGLTGPHAYILFFFGG